MYVFIRRRNLVIFSTGLTREMYFQKAIRVTSLFNKNANYCTITILISNTYRPTIIVIIIALQLLSTIKNKNNTIGHTCFSHLDHLMDATRC